MATNIPARLVVSGLAHRVDKRRTAAREDGTPARDYAVVTVLTDEGGLLDVLFIDEGFASAPGQGTYFTAAVDVDLRAARGSRPAELSARYVGAAPVGTFGLAAVPEYATT